jgi:single-strand DNA-binding protein
MLQEITLIGRLGSDPEARYLPDGTMVTSFSVATSEYVGKDKVPNCPKGWKESYSTKGWEYTVWWRVTCWRGLAETANNYLEKGRLVFIKAQVGGEIQDGVMNPRVWQGKDGSYHCSYEVTARVIKFIDRKDSGGGQRPIGEAPPDTGYSDYGGDVDPLPF